MRFNGTLKKWNDDKGFGFIQPVGGGDNVFVHISAFPRNTTQRPQIGDAITFEITAGHDGKKKAVAVLPVRPATAQPAHPAPPTPRIQPERQPSRHRSSWKWVATVVTIGIVLSFGLKAFNKPVANPVTSTQPTPLAQPSVPPVQLPQQQTAPSQFTCDGRKYCSQMTSCTEAKLFLQNCPGVEMDGNHDGVPCEQQWCTSPVSR